MKRANRTTYRADRTGDVESGDYDTPWGPGQTRAVRVVGNDFGVPTDAVAVALHVTTTNPTAPGSNRAIWNADETPPANGAQINFGTNTTVHALTNDLVISEISANGEVNIRNKNGTTDIIVEIVGYYS